MSRREFIKVLFDKHAEQLFCFIYRRIGHVHVTEEMVSTVFLKAFNSIDEHRENPWPFIRRIAQNLVNDYYRKLQVQMKSQKKVQTEVLQNEVLDPEKAILNKEYEENIEERTKLLNNLLNSSSRLKENHKTCIVLKFFLNKTFEEISIETGLSMNQVKSCIQYGVKILREELEEKMGELKK